MPLTNFKIFHIDESAQKVSEILNYALSNNGSNLIISDHLSARILWYAKKDSQFLFQKVIEPNRSVEHSFISDDISEEVINFLEKLNVLHTLYLDCSLDDDILRVSASFPNIFWEDKATEKIGYKNVPVVISGSFNKNLQDLKVVEIKSGDAKVPFTHTKVFTGNSSDFYLFPIKKGWPVSGTDSNPASEVENPFVESFYKEAPALAIFNKTGEYQSSIGQLPLWYQQNLTGYSYFSPMVKFSNPSQAFLCDAYTGQIYSIDLKNNGSELVLDIFNLELNSSGVNLEPSSLSLQYITDKERELTNRVEDFLIVEDSLYAIVSSKNGFFMARYNLKSKSLEEDFAIPTVFEGFKVSIPRLLNDGGEIKIIGIGLDDLDQQVVLIGDTKTTLRD